MPTLEKRPAKPTKQPASSTSAPAPIRRTRKRTPHRNSQSHYDGPPDRHPKLSPDRQPPGRVRRYFSSDDPNAEWNPRSVETPEGRLSGRRDSDWYVPIGDETHLRTDDGRLRLEDPTTGGHQYGDSGSGSDSRTDSLSSNQSRYRSDDFYVKTTNSHDHKEQWRITVTPEMSAAIDSILRSKKLPFRGSRQQFAAVALYELIQLCTRLEPIPDSHVAVLEAMNDLNRNYQVVVGFDSMMRQQCRTVHDLIERGLKNQARVMVHDLIRTVERIKSRELREKHLKRIKAEFGRLIGEAKPVSGRPVRTNQKKQ